MNDIVFPPHVGEDVTVTHVALYSETPRTWRQRLLSWPWRPWQKYHDPIILTF